MVAVGRWWLTAAALTAAAGCSSSTTGEPSAVTPISPPPSSLAPTSDSPKEPLRQLDPCSLITPDDEQALGASASGEREDLSQSRGCGWIVRGSHSFGVAFFDELGIDEMNIDGRRVSVTINGRDAERIEENSGPGICTIAFPITEHSVAQATASARIDTAKACQVAEQVARIIEPRLP